ncbi:TrkH family potassium uptake protein [Varunaivibrio sulfuroxidans]|uniref:Trk system potassium uptake protein n=1 Tax=Varunaivibrio sulfuroxidans TaxID=1773489 RepID=A0A4R3JGF6_9PROT|nr:TrkH family potassium uptake protein [Varunaivibrio sulfuroxidans]TCS64967.1 trk system potassium uptake protein TrkH [Varunaivibrio sulfuroxidans]WES29741.1 TrkH family potassium uptake protein [Varunaivibrio sulfuroxidans]
MIGFRPIFIVIGMMLVTLSAGMIIPAAVDAAVGHADWQVFTVSAGATLFVGISMTLTSRSGEIRLTPRQAFIMTVLSWIVMTLFAALPFHFSELKLSFTDAFFEAMSGLTTTGSTVIVGLDHAPPGILLWRALLQWLGGIGIIVTAIAVMPMLRVGGMQLFRMESSDQSEKTMPRATQIATAIGGIYLGLTIIWAVAYKLAGMTGFDAVVHAMTTLATGGFSNSDASVGLFDNTAIDIVAIVGMIVGALPFILYLKALRGDVRALIFDSQVRWFLTIAATIVLIATAWLWLSGQMGIAPALRHAAFNVISVMTGTGYATHDFGLWGSLALPLFFFTMFIGGCAGSTTCGIKIFRFQILYAATRVQVHRLLQPHGVFIPYYNRRPVDDEVIISVLSFFFVFGLCFAALAIGLGLVGLDFLTAISSAATAIANVGPALGPIVGPSGTFQSLPDAAKWMLSVGMLLGRLELFTVLVLFSPTFWRG